MKILLLEDDFVLSDLISNFLARTYTVDIAYNADDAMNKIDDNKYDIFVFDINLPGQSGISLLKDLREYKNTTPTIFISAYHDIKTLQEAFDTGANDYLKKPFELEELCIRIQNIILQNNMTHEEEIVNGIKFYNDKHLLLVGDKKHYITTKESEVLSYLISKKKQVVSFEEIYYNVWEYESMPTSDTTLRTYIKNIRKIIGKESIKTIYKQGYIFE
jgi:DNA-binding response OmpR family regulator